MEHKGTSCAYIKVSFCEQSVRSGVLPLPWEMRQDGPVDYPGTINPSDHVRG